MQRIAPDSESGRRARAFFHLLEMEAFSLGTHCAATVEFMTLRDVLSTRPRHFVTESE